MLEEIRREIDRVDDKILELLEKRMELVKKVGHLKNSTGSAIYRPERERSILERLSAKPLKHLTPSAIEAIFLEIFAVARNIERPEKVAYLGPEGSYTHQAAESRFGGISDYLAVHSIQAVFAAVESGRAKFGVVPIENNTEGVVGETFDLLAKSPLKIVAEVIMPIHHALATRCEKVSEIKKIYSKDIAFGQCRTFLSDYELEGAELIPVESTAKAARLAAAEEGAAAICGAIAAKLNNLPILFENIEDQAGNSTRFVILSDFKNSPSGRDKTSIFVRLKNAHKPGALFSFLKDFNDAGINLTKIESRPARESGFGYYFFIDFEGHIDDDRVAAVVERHRDELVWLGSYVSMMQEERQG